MVLRALGIDPDQPVGPEGWPAIQTLIRACSAWVEWCDRGSGDPPAELSLVYDFVDVPYLGVRADDGTRSEPDAVEFVRVGWSQDGALHALSSVGDFKHTWRVDGNAATAEGRLTFVGRSRYTGGSLPKPDKSTEWAAAGLRLRGVSLELRGNDGRVATYVHPVGLKGFASNPHDPSLVAALDRDGRVVVLRVHR